MQSQETIIEMRNITKRFPGVVANDDVTLKIHRGEIFALLGENGAGKSTLASILFGMYQPDEGEIILRGQAEQITNPARAVELDIGMVHQHFKLISDYTVTENIIIGNEPIRQVLGFIPMVDIRRANEDIQNLIDQYGFGLSATDIIEDLNVSSQQRVEILKMLYRDAEILIFDEPTAMLTPQEIERLLEIIVRLHDAGKTIILITHKLDEIKQVAERCAIMNHGKLIGVYDVATTSTQMMANLMVGRELSMAIEKEPASFNRPVLEVSGLSVKDSANILRLDAVSFSVHAGEVFALAGVAGNGQMELADALAGLLSHSGEVHINGNDMSSASVRMRTEQGLAYIPEDRQDVGLLLDMNIAENLIAKTHYQEPYATGAFLQPLASISHADDIIVRYDIRCAQGSSTVVRSMSGGNQQKLLVAREIDADADLVIFVQPTRGLDIGATLAIRQRIVDERDKGKAILLISLDLDEVMAVADTIGVIYNGRITKVSPAQDVTLEELGEYMMGVRFD
ncbi:MAG: ABC transporter ATP-binding protein [Coriobacteriia bacterium]|nr:ABC transporter ATP-binding protein [Coriobacteriia bacterium]